jgi:hypothetical protein
MNATPCTHCGECCRAELCVPAEKIGLTGPPCQAIVVRKGKTYCRLIETAIEMGGFPTLFSLGVGVGCTNETAGAK